VLASSLLEARMPAWLLTAGGAGTAALLERQDDLVDVWARRTLDPPQPARTLARARALRESLRGWGGLEPVVLLLVQAYFGAEEEVGSLPAGVVSGLRGLFVHHAGQRDRPAWAGRCERWMAVGVGEESRLGAMLGELLA
jgi:hypothetical protein